MIQQKAEIPVSERRSPTKENGFGLGLRLIQEAEERVMFHTILPEDLALVPTDHLKLQGILMRPLQFKYDL